MSTSGAPPSVRCTGCPQRTEAGHRAHCALRDEPIDAPGASFCANHPEAGEPPVDFVLGPVMRVRDEAVHVVAVAPDGREIRNAMLAIADDVRTHRIAELTLRERVALWQLADWGERRSFVLLDRFDGPVHLPGAAPTDPAQHRGALPIRPFASSAGRARFAVGALAVTAVWALVALVSDQQQVGLLEQIAIGDGVSKAEAEANDARQQTVAVVRGMLLLPTALAFLLWQYRAYANLRALGTRRPSRSPGGSVGVWFIPFANLVLPHSVIQELAAHSGEPGARSLRGLVLAWWLTFIGASVASRVAGVVLERSDGLGGLVAATRVQQVFHLLWAGSAVLAILVVRAVVRRQTRRPDVVAAFD